MSKNARRITLLISTALMMSACTTTGGMRVGGSGYISAGSSAPSSGVIGGHYKIGSPYQIAGRWYYPKEQFNLIEEGIASWYGPNFHGKLTANGEVFDQYAITAAHRTLQMPSVVRVTNLENGRQLVLRVNDRGPFAKDRIIDISRAGAQALGFLKQGTARVRIEVLGEKSRALKAAIQAGEGGAGTGFVAAPSGNISTQSLAPPGAETAPRPSVATGDQVAAAQPENLLSPWKVKTNIGAPEPIAQPSSSLNAPDPASLEGPSSARVALDDVGVAQPGIATGDRFVQAGAYGTRENAEKVRSVLATLGPAILSPVSIGGRELYRVRLGPLTEAAMEAMLSRVQAAGFPEAVIVE